MTLGEARQYGVQCLQAVSPSAAADAEYLLEKASGASRLRMRSHPEAALAPSAWQAFEALLSRRAGGEPVAYCVGERGFMDFTLSIDTAVLIPRPETELLITTALNYPSAHILDLGTGSGCIAIAMARAWPSAQIVAVDQCAQALAGNWYAPVNGARFDLILANPPYIADAEPHPDQGDARFEPRTALRAGPTGLEAISAIIQAAPQHLQAGGWIWLEHGYRQGEAVRAQLTRNGFNQVTTHSDLAGHERVSGAQWSALP
jgi:release factor glutamine methyltransferase